MIENQNKWTQVLEAIKLQLSPDKFDTWFRNITFAGVKDNTVQLLVPNTFFYEYLSKNYGTIILAEVSKIFNIEEVFISVKEQEVQQAESSAIKVESRKPVFNTHLSNDYTFENYVKGEANKLARSIAMTIATKPRQTAFNPFLIYGDSGVGKSHLVNALGLKMVERNPEKRVLYISAHDFLMQYTDSVPKNKFNDFMYFYQSIDCLIIDDIHEISGKPKTQEALFNIFNHLQRNGRQIVITTDKAPAKLVGFEERVLSRFTMGATIELQRPDEKLRYDILKAKIRKNQLSIPKDAVEFIAQNVTGNVRELEGVINTLLIESIVNSCDINIDMTRKVVAKLVKFNNTKITVEMVVSAVCKHYKVTQKELNSTSRKGNIVMARQMAMYLTQKHTEMSTTQIGMHIGRRDHTTVLYACNKMDNLIKKDQIYKEEMKTIEHEMLK